MSVKAPVLETMSVETQTNLLSSTMIQAAVDRAGRRIAPLWPLGNFVAVNPYLGLTDHTFEMSAQILGRRAGAYMTAPRAFFAEAIQDGRITIADLEAALTEGMPIDDAPRDADALKAFALSNQPRTQGKLVPTVTDAAEKVTQKNWSDFVIESISRWAAAYYDQGQAYWKSPWRDLSPYAAWQAEAALDRTPEINGIYHFRKTVANLPTSAGQAIEFVLNELKVPVSGLDAYLHRLFLTINGWASYGRYQLWEAELRGNEDNTLIELLAIRLVWEVALLNAFDEKGVNSLWQVMKHELSSTELEPAVQAQMAGELLLQRAFEKAYQRELFAQLLTGQKEISTERKQVQAAFCIDVRSEVFRRALETVSDGVETIGFAGFFGFAIEYVRLGDTYGSAQCPALITPQFVIRETVPGVSESEEAKIRERRTVRQRATKAWRMFKFGAVSCFGFVGPVGLAYIKNLVLDTFGWGRPVPLPAAFGLDQSVYKQLAPSVEPQAINGRLTGISIEQRLDVAENALRTMSLTENMARLVLFVGHGATTVNNPYATGLDCGACGGNSGEANARVAVQVLNDPSVRVGLKQRGIIIPEDTVFVAAQHDTTTDVVTIFDKENIPSSHITDIAQIEAQLASAGRLARAERAALLDIDKDADVDTAVTRRSTDWSQVRPEWGLAGCAAFIVAPRERTVKVDLGGRSFLHSYNWKQDKNFSALELIMTAPMVVASWINLQYFGSAVDNDFFGSGNKVLHNVVGTLGVLEGNGGDLRVGLPWQSVHNGAKFVHEPLRLTVMIEAPTEAMTEIIAKNETVRDLLDNRWLYLFALDDSGKVSHQYSGDLKWTLY